MYFIRAKRMRPWFHHHAEYSRCHTKHLAFCTLCVNAYRKTLLKKQQNIVAPDTSGTSDIRVSRISLARWNYSLNYPREVIQPPSKQERYNLFFFSVPFCTYKLTDACREAKTLATWLMTKSMGPIAATSRDFRHCSPTRRIAQQTYTQNHKESQNRLDELESSG